MIKNWEEWDEKYKPLLDEDDCYVLFNPDAEILSAIKADHIWTVVKDDKEREWIIPGMHLVNVAHYIITKNPNEETQDFKGVFWDL